MKINIHFCPYPAHFFLEWEMFQKNAVEKIKPHISWSVTFFFNSAIYEIMWKNIVHPGRPQMIIWHMHIARWIPKAKNIPSKYVIPIAFPLQQWLQKHATVLHYTYIVCLVVSLIRQRCDKIRIQEALEVHHVNKPTVDGTRQTLMNTRGCW